jgi:two-component system, NarL family, response regulator
MIRVLIVDDHPIVREGLAALVERGGDMRVIAEAANGAEGVAAVLRDAPDVILMDLNMPVLGGVDAIIEIRAKLPAARVIVLTTFDGEEDIYRALSAGAKGYVLKDAPRAALLDAIRVVHGGGACIPPAVAERLLARSEADVLSSRENDVLRALADGLSNKEIATRLGIGDGTVKTHLKAVFDKLGAHDRTQAVLIATRRGLMRG